MRWGRAAAATLILVVAATGATAGTTANVERAAGASVYLQAERGVYLLRVTGTEVAQGTHAGSARVEVKMSRCAADGCAHDLVRYATMLAPGALRIADDLSTAKLSVAFAGAPLVIDWTRSQDGPRAATTRFANGGAADFYAEQTFGMSADARVTVVGQTCASGEAFIGFAAEVANPDRGIGLRPIPRTVPAPLRYRLFCL